MSDVSDDRVRDRGRRDKPAGRADNFRDRSRDRGGREPRSMKSSNNRVYVSNLPYEYRWQDVKDLFRAEVGDVAFVELFYDDFDKPRGTGIVEFSDSASVAKCMEVMQRHEVKGRKLTLKEDAGNMRDRHGAIVTAGSARRAKFRDDFRQDNNSFRGDDMKWGQTYGLSVHFLDSLRIDPPLGTKVFIANLDYNVDEKKLKDAFKLAGKVVSAEIPLDKDGRSRGFGIVEYDHPVEAVQAISMFHNQSYFERTITVRMDRASDSFKLPEGFRGIGMGLGPKGEPLRNVAYNLPSLANNSQGNSGGNALMGNANNLPFGNAVSGLGGLGGLGSHVLNAATLTNLSNNLLGQNLGNPDLSSIAAVAANAATQQLAALTAQNVTSNLNPSNSISNYGRTNQGNGSGGGGDFNYGNQSSQGYSTGGNNSNSNRDGGFDNQLSFTSNTGGNRPDTDKRRVMVSNLPSTVSYKLLSDKFAEYGDVISFDTKPNGSVVLTYGSDWQAERAIKNLDKARVSGRLIEARHY